MKMTKDAAWEKWLAKLRDPDSKQFFHKLESFYNPEERCCLGHACHVLISHLRTAHDDSSYVEYDGAEEGLPPSVAKMLDVSSLVIFREQVFTQHGYFNSAAALNDSTKFSLNEIADILEKERERGNLVSFDHCA